MDENPKAGETHSRHNQKEQGDSTEVTAMCQHQPERHVIAEKKPSLVSPSAMLVTHRRGHFTYSQPHTYTATSCFGDGNGEERVHSACEPVPADTFQMSQDLGAPNYLYRKEFKVSN